MYYKDNSGNLHQDPPEFIISSLQLISISEEEFKTIETEKNTPSLETKLSILQLEYESNRNQLNQAWLAAAVADGANEDARKVVIRESIAALDAEYDVAVMTILQGA